MNEPVKTAGYIEAGVRKTDHTSTLNLEAALAPETSVQHNDELNDLYSSPNIIRLIKFTYGDRRDVYSFGG